MPVISKVHRLNLPRLAHNQERKRLVAADRKKAPSSRIAKHRRGPVGAPADLPIPPVPSEGLISLLKLTDHTCKWPVGDPKQQGFGFCGAAPVLGKPYCAESLCCCVYRRPGPRPAKGGAGMKRSANASLDIVEAGIDVTSMVGAQPLAEERYREAFAVATSNPSVPNFRSCVAAYDDLIRIVEGATYGTNPKH